MWSLRFDCRGWSGFSNSRASESKMGELARYPCRDQAAMPRNRVSHLSRIPLPFRVTLHRLHRRHLAFSRHVTSRRSSSGVQRPRRRCPAISRARPTVTFIFPGASAYNASVAAAIAAGDTVA